MLSRDYILAQIEMISGLVARLMRLREDGDEQGAVEEVEEGYREMFRLEPRLVGLLPSDFLLNKLRTGDYLDLPRGLSLAVLMREDAVNYGSQGNDIEQYQRLVGSLKVFLAVVQEHQLLPEHLAVYDVQAVLDHMTEYELPLDLKFDLFHYYEDAGEYAHAEDMLHEAIDDSDRNQEIIDEGIQFYEWLLGHSDEELVAGNLPRMEVEESLAQLRRLKTGQ